MKYKPTRVALDQLLLDPNNYRFLDKEEHVRADPTRYHEVGVQDKARTLIERDGLDDLRALKESIQTNGYVPVEMLVVQPYVHKEGMFVVVEGNRRVAAMRWLLSDKRAGAPVSDELLETFKSLPALVLDPGMQALENTYQILMGLRHVSGIKQWGGYQRTKLLVDLVDGQHMGITEAAKAISMSPNEATRRFKAFRALQQMINDDEFGAYAGPRMYSFFHEAVAQPKIRKWLSWDDKAYEFKDEEATRAFYRLLIPSKPDDQGDEGFSGPQEPKLKTYADVRALKDILGDEDAEEALLNPAQSLNDALATAKSSGILQWAPRMKSALQALDKIPVDTLKRLSAKDIKPMQDLYNSLKERLIDWGKLTGKKIKV